jgi:dephospho-CoA kinase
MSQNTMSQKIVIGICGTLCAGKGIVSEILGSKGCDVIKLGAVVRESLNSQGIEATREAQQNEGNRLRSEFGGQVLAEKVLEKYANSPAPLVIDGIRNMAEIEYLEKHSKFFLIGVDAPFEDRFERSNKRNRDAKLGDYDTFKATDERDQGLNEPETGQRVGDCMQRADFTIVNDEDYVRLEHSKIYRETIKIYEEIMKDE